MEDQLTAALIARLQPILYVIGLLVVLGFISFGGTILSWFLNRKEKRDDALLNSVNENTIAIARLDAKFDLFVQRHEKDLQGLGNKIRNLEV